jgi:SAM-dependent methyltransferase
MIREMQHDRKILSQAKDIWGWESPAGKMRARARQSFILRALEPKPGMSILEVGCGLGVHTRVFSIPGVKVDAVDISKEFIGEASSNFRRANTRFHTAAAESLPFSDGKFDAVVGISTLHHLDMDAALREFHRVLKPAGKLIFTEPNLLNPMVFLERNVGFIKRRHFVSDDETAFVRWSLERQLRTHGFKNIRTVPFDLLHPQLPSWMLSPAVAVADFSSRIPLIREFLGSIKIYAVKG